MKLGWKATLICFIILISIFGCKQIANDSQRYTLKGTWIYSEYRKVGISTWSPSKAFSDTFDGGPSCLSFNEKMTIPFKFGSLFSPDVGGGVNTVFKYSSIDSSYYVGSSSSLDYKLKFRILQKDTFLVMTDNPKLSHEKLFIKISNQIQREPYLFFFQNYVLSGKYSVFDSLGKELPHEVNFKKDGTLDFFDPFQKYDIDFNPEYSVDIFSFQDKNNREFEFTPEYNGRELKLFEVIFMQDSAIKGSLRYTLIKRE